MKTGEAFLFCSVCKRIVTLKSPGNDYSIIAETKGSKTIQKVTFTVTGGLSQDKLSVWCSNSQEQFVKLDDVIPVNGSFQITLDPESIYSITTTSSQQKGQYANVPASKPFPFPYKETFEEYKYPKAFGYLPHYTADIAGIFEIADRPDKKGKCLRQVIQAGSQSWAPEWSPYTVLGDSTWTNYEVSADINLNKKGWAGIMGHVLNTGTGYGVKPSGYYLNLSADGNCSLYISKHEEKVAQGVLLAKGKALHIGANSWHNIKLRFSGTKIIGFVDNKQVIEAKDTTFTHGMAGLVTGSANNANNDAMFDNIEIKPVMGKHPKQNVFPEQVHPMYTLLK